MTKKFDVGSFGSITIDLFLDSDEIDAKNGFFRLPVGDKIKLDSVKKFVGGGAANTSVGFSKMGLRSTIFGVVGGDDDANFIEKTLRKNKVCVDSMIREKDGGSSFSVILTARDGKRIVFHHRNTNRNFGKNTLFDAPPCRAIYIGHLYQSSENLLDAVPNFDGLVAWNPGKTQFESGFQKFEKIFPHIDILILNVEELEGFSQISAQKIPISRFSGEKLDEPNTKSIADVRRATEKFFAAGVRQIVVTDGERGSQFFDKKNHFWIPAFGGIPTSTLGAGDAFSVGFVAAQLHEKSPKTAMKWGARNSASVIQKFGAQSGQLFLEDVKFL